MKIESILLIIPPVASLTFPAAFPAISAAPPITFPALSTKFPAASLVTSIAFPAASLTVVNVPSAIFVAVFFTLSTVS